MGRPATAPIKLKDGFYIEVFDRGSKSGVKLNCMGKNGMLQAIRNYEKAKDIVIWGELKDGKWVSEKRIYDRNVKEVF